MIIAWHFYTYQIYVTKRTNTINISTVLTSKCQNFCIRCIHLICTINLYLYHKLQENWVELGLFPHKFKQKVKLNNTFVYFKNITEISIDKPTANHFLNSIKTHMTKFNRRLKWNLDKLSLTEISCVCNTYRKVLENSHVIQRLCYRYKNKMS